MYKRQGIKVFVNVYKDVDAMGVTVEKYSKHVSFAGYNFDEPVIYKNIINFN